MLQLLVDFTNATDCTFDTVATLMKVTPQKVKDCLASFRSDLTRIISNWERSGQGDGGHQENDDDEGDGDNEGDDEQLGGARGFGVLCLQCGGRGLQIFHVASCPQCRTVHAGWKAVCSLDQSSRPRASGTASTAQG